jgi:hypothetical protein
VKERKHRFTSALSKEYEKELQPSPGFSYSLEMNEFINILLKSDNSVALVRKRTIPTERPPLVGEVSANFCG